MSRGLGRMQRLLQYIVLKHGKPMTFAEIKATILAQHGINDPTHPLPRSVERSLRRALSNMVKDAPFCTVGKSRPYRYFIHPMAIGCMGDTPQAKALFAALQEAVEAYSGGFQVHF